MTFAKVEIKPNGNGIHKGPKKIVFACPTYGPTDPKSDKHRRVAIMVAASRGLAHWIGDVSTNRMGWDAARNVSAQSALGTEAEGIVWMDSDIVAPPDAIAKLLMMDADFCSGMYFQREPPHFPLVAKYDENGNTFRWVAKWPEDVIFQADGIGFGMCYTSTALLRKMVDDIESVSKDGWFCSTKGFSEDLHFCRNANVIGVRPYVDTTLLVGHQQDPQEVVLDDFRRCYQPAKPPLQAKVLGYGKEDFIYDELR